MTYIDVLEAIAGRMASLWPERMLCRDFCPAGHKRPSGLLCVERAKMEDINLGLVQRSLEARLELYAATDGYSVESMEQLRADQTAVLGQFGGPALAVGGRHIQVSTAADTPGPGVAYAIFSAQWMDARSGCQDPGTADTPKMKHFTVERTAL